MTQVERRRHPRIQTDVPLHLTFQDATIETKLRDLSSSGIRFRAPAALPLLSRVQIALELPDKSGGNPSAHIAISGVVVRCDELQPGGPAPFDTAIYFEELTDHARSQLSRFLAAHGV